MKLKKAFIIIVPAVFILMVLLLPESTKRTTTPHFTFIFSSSIDTTAIMKLSGALESNYSRVAYDLQTQPSDQIETHVYAHRWSYIRATGNWAASGNIEGISKLYFVNAA